MKKITMKIYYKLPNRIRKFYLINSKQIHRLFFFLVTILIIGISLWVFFGGNNSPNQQETKSVKKDVFELAFSNYQFEVKKYAKEFDLPASYLMALIILECSGKKDIKPRFERSVYNRLKNLKKKKRKKFEVLTYKDVKDANNAALKNLASSWGPFQLMGYKCVGLGITIADLRGEKRVYWAIKWIDMEYGDLLRKKRFKDAFHYHNTGHVFPKNNKSKTYDPKYVQKGLKYMKYFEKVMK